MSPNEDYSQVMLESLHGRWFEYDEGKSGIQAILRVGEALNDLHEATTRINTFFDALGEKGMQNIEQGVEAMSEAKDWITGLFG